MCECRNFPFDSKRFRSRFDRCFTWLSTLKCFCIEARTISNLPGRILKHLSWDCLRNLCWEYQLCRQRSKANPTYCNRCCCMFPFVGVCECFFRLIFKFFSFAAFFIASVFSFIFAVRMFDCLISTSRFISFFFCFRCRFCWWILLSYVVLQNDLNAFTHVWR
jgi:hypothetical protein